MKKFENSKSSLFLMELILAILFFSIASAVCIQLFVRASLINSQSIEKQNAAIKAQNIAEITKGTGFSLESIQALIPQACLENNELKVYYNKDWQVDNNQNSHYILTTKIDGDSIYISVNGKELIYSLTVQHYQQLTA